MTDPRPTTIEMAIRMGLDRKAFAEGVAAAGKDLERLREQTQKMTAEQDRARRSGQAARASAERWSQGAAGRERELRGEMQQVDQAARKQAQGVDQARRSTERLGNEALTAARKQDTFGKSMMSQGSRMAQWGRNALLVTAGVGTAVGAVGLKFISTGEDAVEMENKFDVSFQKMKGQARAWSVAWSKEIGISQFHIRDMMASYNLLLTKMGQTPEAALEMSKQLTKLTYDLKSVWNLPLQDVFVKLRSGLVGETEAVRDLGIAVDEETIKNFAAQLKAASKGTADLAEQQREGERAAWNYSVRQDELRDKTEQINLQYDKQVAALKRRASEQDKLYGDNGKIKRQTGEQIDLERELSVVESRRQEALNNVMRAEDKLATARMKQAGSGGSKGSGAKELTTEEKMYYRYLKFLQDTGKEQGDLARTAQSSANRRFLAQERTSESLTKMSVKANDVWVKFLDKTLPRIGQGMNSLSDWLDANGDKIEAWGDRVVKPAAEWAGRLADWMDRNKERIPQVAARALELATKWGPWVLAIEATAWGLGHATSLLGRFMVLAEKSPFAFAKMASAARGAATAAEAAGQAAVGSAQRAAGAAGMLPAGGAAAVSSSSRLVKRPAWLPFQSFEAGNDGMSIGGSYRGSALERSVRLNDDWVVATRAQGEARLKKEAALARTLREQRMQTRLSQWGQTAAPAIGSVAGTVGMLAGGYGAYRLADGMGMGTFGSLASSLAGGLAGQAVMSKITAAALGSISASALAPLAAAVVSAPVVATAAVGLGAYLIGSKLVDNWAKKQVDAANDGLKRTESIGMRMMQDRILNANDKSKTDKDFLKRIVLMMNDDIWRKENERMASVIASALDKRERQTGKAVDGYTNPLAKERNEAEAKRAKEEKEARQKKEAEWREKFNASKGSESVKMIRDYYQSEGHLPYIDPASPQWADWRKAELERLKGLGSTGAEAELQKLEAQMTSQRAKSAYQRGYNSMKYAPWAGGNWASGRSMDPGVMASLTRLNRQRGASSFGWGYRRSEINKDELRNILSRELSTEWLKGKAVNRLSKVDADAPTPRAVSGPFYFQFSKGPDKWTKQDFETFAVNFATAMNAVL